MIGIKKILSFYLRYLKSIIGIIKSFETGSFTSAKKKVAPGLVCGYIISFNWVATSEV